MTAPAVAALPGRVGGAVLFDASLARYTTYRIGGPAAALVEPAHRDDVVEVLAFARQHELPWLALGLGSNLLVSDLGFPGVVVRIGKRLADCWPPDAESDHWRVGAGLPTPVLARKSAEAGWGGVHRLIGVPGTVGGGVYMNAGAHGQEYRDTVREVELVTAGGRVECRAASEISWEYRSSGLGDVVVLGASLALTSTDSELLSADIEEHLRWRKAETPFTEPCCGSVFRNPAAAPRAEGDDGAGAGETRTAGQLIDAAGMKGHRVGGAQVSTVHANYIVNTGYATARDVLAVIDAVRERVMRAFGVELRLEVRVVGEP